MSVEVTNVLDPSRLDAENKLPSGVDVAPHQALFGTRRRITATNVCNVRQWQFHDMLLNA